MPKGGQVPDILSFGPFRLYRRQRVLKCKGAPVKLGSRAFEILLALVDNAGEVVSHKELLARVWPGVFVEAVSLRFHITALRKALDSAESGSRYLTTVPGRGYCFVAAISREANDGEVEEVDDALVTHAPPPAPGRMVGRDDTVREVCANLTAQRFVTIVGPGGMGKTTVAVSVAHQLLDDFRGAVCFVELSPLSDPRLLAGTVASAFGLAVQTQDPTAMLVAHLRGRRILLILDNSEHLIADVANLAQRLFDELHELYILVTSRETLRADGEYIYRLPPLESPPEKESLTIAETLAFPATQLFVERMARSGGKRTALSAEDARMVGDICRKLGGIALAIELAAGLVEAYGIRQTAKLLDSRFALLWPGRRTAPPRHQTLSATLDWSYNLLSDTERAVLRRLSVCIGGFTLEAAQSVAGAPGVKDEEVFDAVDGLFTKSLIAADASGPRTRYRLLDTTRVYAATKLAESRERDTVRHRHALYFRDALQRAGETERTLPGAPMALAADIDNVRAALDWALSPHGDAELGIDLAALSVPLWMGKALLTECRDWMTRASRVPVMDAAPTRQQLVIQLALASALVLTSGITDDFKSVWTKTLELAVDLNDVPAQLASHTALWGQAIRGPDYAEALRFAESCAAVVRGDPDLGREALAEWMLGITHHHVGRHDAGRFHLQRALDIDTEDSRFAQLRQIGYDRRVAIIGVMANLFWCKGFAEEAARWGTRALEEASKLDYPLPLGVAMTWAGFNRYLSDEDTDAIESDMVELADYAATHRIDSDHGIALCLLGLCQARRDHYEAAEPLVLEGLRLMADARYEVFSPIVRAHLCEAALTAGRIERATAIMSELDARDRNSVHFCSPEILRVKGVLARNGADRAAARVLFEEAIVLSRRQGALSFELRAATSLSKLMAEQGFGKEALDLTESVYARFDEGFGSADLLDAKRLIGELK